MQYKAKSSLYFLSMCEFEILILLSCCDSGGSSDLFGSITGKFNNHSKTKNTGKFNSREKFF